MVGRDRRLLSNFALFFSPSTFAFVRRRREDSTHKEKEREEKKERKARQSLGTAAAAGVDDSDCGSYEEKTLYRFDLILLGRKGNYSFVYYSSRI